MTKDPQQLRNQTREGGERAWLIERAGEHGPEWATVWSGGFEFTNDSTKAIRFCRREDANQVAEIFDGEDVRITEHIWDDGGRAGRQEQPREAQAWMASITPRPELVAVSPTVWGIRYNGQMVCAPTIEEAVSVLRAALATTPAAKEPK